MGAVLEGKPIGLDQKNSAKRRAPDLENQESGYGPRYSLTQGLNLLQISPNWFLGNWTLDPSLKWAYAFIGACGDCHVMCNYKWKTMLASFPFLK
jgi:hypothetical protein